MRRALCALVLACALPAFAAPAAPGVVMRVDDQELFVNLGQRDGVRAGSRLALYRRVVLTHPLSGAEVEDRFPIGVVVLNCCVTDTKVTPYSSKNSINIRNSARFRLRRSIM